MVGLFEPWETEQQQQKNVYKKRLTSVIANKGFATMKYYVMFVKGSYTYFIN